MQPASSYKRRTVRPVRTSPVRRCRGSAPILACVLPLLGASPRVGGDDAAEAAPVTEMDEFVVTATRDRQPIDRVSANVTVLTAEEIEESGATTVVEALRRLGGVHFRSPTGQNAQAQIDLRGFGENSHLRTLVLLDGHRLNRPDMGGIEWTRIPLGSVERIEIVRGGSGALQGSSAVGGVVNIITKDLAPSSTAGEGPTVTASGTVGAYGLDERRVSVEGVAGGLGFSLDVSRLANEGYRDRSALQSNGLAFSLQRDLGEAVSVTAGISSVESEYEFPGALTRQQMQEDRRQAAFDDHDGASRTITLDLGVDAGVLQDCCALLEAQWSQRDLNWYMGTYTKAGFESLSFTPRFFWSGRLGDFDERLTLGVDAVAHDVNPRRYQDRSASNLLARGDLQQRSLGVYVRSETTLFQDTVIEVSARRERARTAAEVDDFFVPTRSYSADKDFNGTAASLGVTRFLTDTMRAFGRFDHVYRYPALDEIADYQGAYMAEMFNDDLEAETGRNVEVGYQVRGARGMRAGLSLYQLTMRNEIAWDQNVNRNLDETRRRGLEFSARLPLAQGWSVEAAYTGVSATYTDGPSKGRDIPLVPERRFSGSLEADLGAGFSLRLDARHTSSVYQGSGEQAYQFPKLDAYTVWDVLVRYAPPRFQRSVKITLGADNLFDEHHVSAAYYGGLYPAPGRRLKAGVTVRF